MKKLSIFIVLMLVAMAASAQSGREKGFVFRPEVGLGFYGVNTFENICTINTFEKTVKDNSLMAKGYFFSIGFGWEVNRSSSIIGHSPLMTHIPLSMSQRFITTKS